MAQGWWFEDALPGGTILHRAARTVGPAEHVWLAWITGNASDIHGDAHRAAQGPFGEPLVLGALTAAIVIGLASPAEGLHSPAREQLRGWRSVALGRPVVAGDTLRAVSEVHATEAAAEAGGGYVERTIRGFTQKDEVVVTIRETCYAPHRPGA